MKIRFVLFIFVVFTASLNAQRYRTAFGLRLSENLGFTAQQLISKHRTVEGIVHVDVNEDRLGFTVLGERHQSLLTRRLNVYFGLGAHYFPKFNEEQNAYYGTSFIGGLELSIGRLNLAYDILPQINVNGTKDKLQSEAGISCRYIIIKAKKNKKFRLR